MILTDAKGRPFDKPEPADYPTTWEFLRAFHAYRDRVADCANKAFAEEFHRALRRPS